MVETKITTKYQTTIPNDIRSLLNVVPGDSVEWETIKGMVVVHVKKKIKDPVKFLTSQIKLPRFDAIKMIKEAREEFQ